MKPDTTSPQVQVHVLPCHCHAAPGNADTAARAVPRAVVTTLAVSLALALPAAGDVAFDNFGPGNTFTGNGWLLQGPQSPPGWSHAFPFTAVATGEVTSLTVALHHLENNNGYTFEIRADDGGAPGAVLGALGEVAGFLEGDVPIQFSTLPGVTLDAGTTYWLHGRGIGAAWGTWRQSPDAGGIRAYSFDGGATWTGDSISSTNGVSAFRIEVASAQPCYPDCDDNGILNINDFLCFIDEFAQAQALPTPQQVTHYANCTGATAEPVLAINDFLCFIDAFAQGCP